MKQKKEGMLLASPEGRMTKSRVHYLPESFECQIEYHKEGVAMVARKKIKSEKKGGGIRGKIKGWSKSSRSRMRDFMLTHEPASDNWHTFGITLTVPGTVLTDAEAKQVWNEYTYKLNRMEVGLVWRKEIQARGQMHWHCVGIKKTVPTDPLTWAPDKEYQNWYGETTCYADIDYTQYEQIVRGWYDAMDKLGVDEYDCSSKPINQKNGTFCIKQTGLRSGHIGANKRAVDIEEHKNNGAWLRYLQDHATKSKQVQIAENSGRHWGIINKKFFKTSVPDELQKLDSRVYCKFLRAYKRMCTTHIPDERCPFGSRLGYTPSYRWGRNVRFSNPESVKKLATWATNDYASQTALF